MRSAFHRMRANGPMRTTRLLSAIGLAIAGLGAGCASPAARDDWRTRDASAQRSRSADSLVEVGDIGEVMRTAGDDLVVLDVRGEAEYAAGHLPGALRIEYDEWAQLSLAGETGLTNERLWHDRIGALGIDGDGTVLIADGGGMTRAARVWFILQHFGVADARVVNGGFPLIAQEAGAGRIALSTESVRPAGVVFRPRADDAGRIGALDRFEVRAAIEAGEAQVLDARTVDEYRGIDLRTNDRGGHLPTAISLPHATLLDADGRLKPADELASILDEAGFVRGRPVITHCDGGGRAALAALAAARAGYGPVVNYYLSFGDWAKDATCPVVTP